MFDGGSSVIHFRMKHLEQSGDQKKETTLWVFFYLLAFGQCCPSVSACPAKVLLCTQNVCTKVLLCTPNVWTKVLLCTTNVWTKKLCLAPRMVEKSLALHPKCLHKWSTLVSYHVEYLDMLIVVKSPVLATGLAPCSKCFNKSLGCTPNVWTKVLLCTQKFCKKYCFAPNAWTKFLLCIQNVSTKILLCTQNIWAKVFLDLHTWNEQKSCFGPKMFEQMFPNIPCWYYMTYSTWILGNPTYGPGNARLHIAMSRLYGLHRR